MGTNITGIGNANAIGFKSRVTGGMYFPPELKDALVGVWSAYGKSNNSTDRNIIKNKIKDKGGDFVISNAAYKLNSGFGKYEEDFDSWIPNYNVATFTYTPSKLHITSVVHSYGILYTHKATNAMKVEVTGMQSLELVYRYITGDDTWGTFRFDGDGIYELPASGVATRFYTGFAVLNYKGDCDITIEQIPSFQGALVTDGVDDSIVSQKTVREMLGGSNEITVVSMIHLIDINHTVGSGFTNYVRVGSSFIRSGSKVNDKTGIYGWTYSNSGNIGTINNILGDKNDYGTTGSSLALDSIFNVEGYRQSSNTPEICQVAWYWTFIANKVLTTDQINQVIAYFNLDRTLKPDILCDVKKQGITNENHAEFGDKLIDFSGNGRDIQLNNIAWKGDSGIGKYETDFTTWTKNHFTNKVNFTPSKIEVTGILNTDAILINNKPTPIYNVEIHSPNKSIVVYYQYNYGTGIKRIALVDGINELPSANDSLFVTSDRLNSKGITITQIPSHAGALCLDGVDDFGKVTGMPIYKDYTVVTDREIFANTGAMLSKNNPGGAFVETVGNSVFSFSQATHSMNIISTRSISYLSKYSYCGQSITAGAEEDGTDMWLGTIRDNDSRFFNGAIYSLMSFPYSMSEFLIERQLKKHKLGTLYPDMVEFRPIVKSNIPYKNILYTIYGTSRQLVVGQYYPISTKVRMTINTIGKVDEVSSVTVNGQEAEISRNVLADFVLTSKSPQKINITIDEYIRYEDIVQPYPVLLRFNDENGNEVSWGGKFRVGSTITRIGSIDDTENNLLNGLYSTNGLSLNGQAVTSSAVIVEKQMIFKTTATYLLDNNEPKVILSPSRLRMPNSSYKILGHIPDISGHDNHGVINNSAYAEMSGANGYLVDFTSWFSTRGIDTTDNKITVNSNYNLEELFVCYAGANSVVVPTFKVHITGIPNGGTMIFNRNSDIVNLVNGENTIEGFTTVGYSGFKRGGNGRYLDWSNLVIQQIGQYEGAYCLDGVDDFVTIPTLGHGGKQVLMKVNWNRGGFIYDQRTSSSNSIAIYAIEGSSIAYYSYNPAPNGKSYIDGILNNNITGSNLKNITHNITCINDTVKLNIKRVPCIAGPSDGNAGWIKMALYDFMLFDDISTEDKIKELNEYVGIEGGYVESPDYYWDCFGKTNDDPDRDIITEQVSKDVANALSVKNAAFKLDSGFGKYEVDFASLDRNNTASVFTATYKSCSISKIIKDGSGNIFYNWGKTLAAINSVRIQVTGLDEIGAVLEFLYLDESGNLTTKQYSTDGIYDLPASAAYQGDSFTSNFRLSVRGYIGDCNITIEQIPEYQNGFVFDGVDDYLENLNIPAFTDFTVIAKRVWINKDNPMNECFIHKGVIHTSIGKSAFMLEFEIANDTYYRSASFSGYKNVERVNRPESITYQTTESYNGIPIIRGSGIDTQGLVIGAVTNNYWKGVFYKLMLYPRPTNMLTINMIKNMMEEDGIIDVTSKLFTDKFTGDFNLDFNNDFLIGN